MMFISAFRHSCSHQDGFQPRQDAAELIGESLMSFFDAMYGIAKGCEKYRHAALPRQLRAARPRIAEAVAPRDFTMRLAYILRFDEQMRPKDATRGR